MIGGDLRDQGVGRRKTDEKTLGLRAEGLLAFGLKVRYDCAMRKRPTPIRSVEEIREELEALQERLGRLEGFASGRVTAPLQRKERRLYRELRLAKENSNQASA